MSRTWKTDPLWVKQVREGVVRHDHRNGTCIEQTPEQAGKTKAGARHRRNCRRISWTLEDCDEETCYQFARAKIAAIQYGWQVPKKCTAEHWRKNIDYTLPCKACDEETPTCLLGAHHSYSWYVKNTGGGGVPRWFVKHITHAPRRTDQRKALGEAAKEYNAEIKNADQNQSARERAEEAVTNWECREMPNRSANWYWW